MIGILRVVGWFAVVSFGFMGYTALSSYYLTIDDVEKITGTVKGDIEYTRDEYDTYNTSMHFYLEGHKDRFGIPGKLLAKAAFRIQDIKDGDEVDVYIQRKKGKTFFSRHLTFSIAKKNQTPLIDIEEAIAFFASPRFILMALFFWGIGLVTIWFLIRPRKVKMTNLESKK
ncbi:MAG: hypothetical protein GY810_10205 [Aureispira sp.]|nr:hypothetical protein [Aureispira sp.]